MRKSLAALLLTSILTACSGGGNSNQIVPAQYPTPAPGQWVAYGGPSPAQIQNNTIQFGGYNNPASYYYTGLQAQVGQTLTLNYTVTGNNPVWVQYPYNSGGQDLTDTNPPSIHLFLWRRGDDLLCGQVTVDYRLFAGMTNLVVAPSQVINVPLTNTAWTNCFGKNPANIADILSNLAGAGFTFGGQSFAGHGIYLSSGSATFKINSFSAK